MASYRTGRSRSGNRGRSVNRRSGTRAVSRRGVSRRATGRRSSGSGGTKTVRLVIEQAAPSVSAVKTPDGYMVPDNSTPKRSKF